MAHASIDTATATALQVLVVDDSQALRTRVRSALERAGLTVVGEAADGAQALTLAATHHPDVVLMDLRMPRMDGIQATRILRRQQPDTPVVLWTGDDDAQLARAVRESGARAGVAKGIGTVELVATLRGVCDAQGPTRPHAAHRHGGAGPRPVEAAAPSAHPGASLDGNLEHLPTGTAHADPLTLQPPGRAEPPPSGLAAAERMALERLGAADGYATRWPVGRQVTRSLANRQLVVVASDYVLLTEAGRRALASDSQHRSRSAPPDPRRADHRGPARSAPG
jgi:CheY-like chemotaxis protein